MKRWIVFVSALLLLAACKKTDKNNTLNPQLVEAAKAVGTYQLSSYTSPGGDLTVFTPQNSPGAITVTKTDASHFHVIISITLDGSVTTEAHDYVFSEITGDGYVHFTETDNHSTALFVDEGGSGDAFSIHVTYGSNNGEIFVSIRQ
ncbi:MAG: hypothetical protein ACRDE2_16250 [Chitinophagaceae bacterium]